MFRKTSLESLDSFNAPINQQIQEHYDYLCKIIIIGPTNSGKSSILHKFINNNELSLTSQTIGVEFVSKVITIGDQTPHSLDNIKMKLQLWDTAGQERFRSLTRSYYRSSAGVILVFDITSRESFNQLDEFMVDIKNLTDDSVSIMLIANKVDLIPQYFQAGREIEIVSNDEIENFVNKFQIELDTTINVVKTTTMTTPNLKTTETCSIDEIFSKIGCSILTKIELGYLNPEWTSSGVQYGSLPYDLSYSSSSVPNIPLLNGTKSESKKKQEAIKKLKRKQSLTLSILNGTRPKLQNGNGSGSRYGTINEENDSDYLDNHNYRIGYNRRCCAFACSIQ